MFNQWKLKRIPEYKAIYHHADMFQKEAKFLRIFFVQRKGSAQVSLPGLFPIPGFLQPRSLSVWSVTFGEHPAWRMCLCWLGFTVTWSRVLPTPFLPLEGRGPSSPKAVLLVSSFMFGCAGSLLLRGLSLVASRVYSSCMGFSLQWLFFLWRTGSRHTGLIALWHVESSLDQSSNPCALHWQEVS